MREAGFCVKCKCIFRKIQTGQKIQSVFNRKYRCVCRKSRYTIDFSAKYRHWIPALSSSAPGLLQHTNCLAHLIAPRCWTLLHRTPQTIEIVMNLGIDCSASSLKYNNLAPNPQVFWRETAFRAFLRHTAPVTALWFVYLYSRLHIAFLPRTATPSRRCDRATRATLVAIRSGSIDTGMS